MTIISSNDEQFNTFSRFLEGSISDSIKLINDYIAELVNIQETTKGATQFLASAGETGMLQALNDFKGISNDILIHIANTNNLIISDIDETTKSANTVTFTRL